MTDRARLTHNELGEIEMLSDLHHIYLKPICKVHITVQISGLSSLGAQNKSLSTWEVSEKVRQLCPGQLPPTVNMKVMGVTVEFVRFLVELNSRSDVKRVVKAADSQCIKLRGFPQTLRVRTCEAPIDCPRKHDWDAFFRDAKDMNELIPGERPDTIVLSKLPVLWFSSNSSSKFQPDPKILVEVFQKFGKVRRVDIPILDPCQNHHLLADMGLTLEDAKEIFLDFHASASEEDNLSSNRSNNHNGFGKIAPSRVKQLFYEEESSSSIDSSYPLTFTAYIQFVDYAGFSTAMETLRGKKLIYAPGDKEGKEESAKFYSAEIKVDFDRTKHLSDVSIRRRRAARIQLESAAREKAEAIARAAEEAARREAELEAARLAEERRLRAEKEAAEKRAEEKARIRAAEKRLRREEKRRRAEEARRLREEEEKRRILHKRLKRELAKLEAKIAEEEANERKRHKHQHHHRRRSHHEKEREGESDYCSEANSAKTHSAHTSSIAIQTSPDKLSPLHSPSTRNHPSPRSVSSSGSASRDRSPLNSEEERMRRKLIAKREAQLRSQILSRLGR